MRLGALVRGEIERYAGDLASRAIDLGTEVEYLGKARARAVSAAMNNGHGDSLLGKISAVLTAQHQGVGVLITNEARTRFYLQNKGKTYPIREYRDCYSFFGGEIDKINGEGMRGALQRELIEELGHEQGQIVNDAAQYVQDFQIKTKHGPFKFTLYQAVLTNEQLDDLANTSVRREGRGELIESRDLSGLKFIWGLERVLDSYLREAYTGPRPQMPSQCVLQHGLQQY